MTSIYQKAQAAMKAEDWEAAYKYYHQFYYLNPSPPKRYKDYAVKTMQTLVREKGVAPPNRRVSKTPDYKLNARKSRVMQIPQSSLPTDEKYALVAGNLRSKQNIADSLVLIGNEGKAVRDIINRKPDFKAQYEEVLKNKILPQFKADASSALAFISTRPTSNAQFVQALAAVDELIPLITSAMKDWGFIDSPVYAPYSFKYRTTLEVKSKAYATKYTGTGLDIPRIIEEFYANAWNHRGPVDILKKYFPENKGRRNIYPAPISKAFQQVNNRADFYWELLPENAAPKEQARKIVKNLRQIDGLTHAKAYLEKHDYYTGWDLKDLPTPVRSELDAAEQRRRKRGVNLVIDFAHLSEPRSEAISIYGFVFNKTSKAKVIDDYTTMLERKFAEPATMLPRIGINSTGLYDRPFYLKKNEFYLEDNKTSVYCMEYKAVRKGNTRATDCFYFVDELLSGFKLNFSEENCSKSCAGYKAPLLWLASYGFKQTGHETQEKNGIASQVWGSFARPTETMNITLWGGLFTSKREEHNRYFEVETQGFRQNAALCVYPNSVEAALKKVSTKSPSYTCQ